MNQAIILLPARNEEEAIEEVIDRIPTNEISDLGFETRVIVIDGHSTDSTVDIAEKRGVEVIRQLGQTGKGTGVREALDSIILEGRISKSDLIIMLDADATYFPEQIPEFIDHLKENDVVWGSRIRGKIEKKAMSRVNAIGNRILSFLASVLYLSRTTDLCTGYWGFRMTSIEKMSLKANGFNLEADLFTSSVKLGLRRKEIPTNYAHREGQSSLRWYADGPRIFMMILSNRIRFIRK